MKLSDKVFIQEAIELLKIQNKPLDYVIHSLMNEENLATYFDVNVDATESTGYEMQPINQDGDELPFVNGNPPKSIEGSGMFNSEMEEQEAKKLYKETTLETVFTKIEEASLKAGQDLVKAWDEDEETITTSEKKEVNDQ